MSDNSSVCLTPGNREQGKEMQWQALWSPQALLSPFESQASAERERTPAGGHLILYAGFRLLDDPSIHFLGL